eukprot:TRINITY_DN11039_c0_g1_i2.p1 TRINITY_DN11039_c0_g1~~TRINITY_DN11039_c0_g1_i2.p1  ORF type:complete len:105 (+),score=23.05 TRINITY_DN11039_c0_g1_i2:123-437(+)
MCKVKPKDVVRRIKVWETIVFAELEPKDASTWRAKKWMEITKYDDEEYIKKQANVIKSAIKKENDEKLRQEKTKTHQGDLMSELSSRLTLVQKAKEDDVELLWT